MALRPQPGQFRAFDQGLLGVAGVALPGALEDSLPIGDHLLEQGTDPTPPLVRLVA